jgi:SAM-dependent methyltransferase
MQTVKFMDQELPEWVAQGNHAQYIIPFAKQICTGVGLDIGGNNPKWSFPGAKIVDPAYDPKYDAFNLPFNSQKGKWDYVFSSHCLEHIKDWKDALKIWTASIKPGGVLFLYLPHPDCLYWRPELMPTKKHINQFSPKQMKKVFTDLGYKNIFTSQRDLAWSFAIFGERV